MRRTAAFILVLLTLLAGGTSAAFAGPAAHPQPEKKLTAYNVIVVNAFTSGKTSANEDAAAPVNGMIHARAVRELQASALFDGVIDAAPVPSENPASADARLDLRISPVQPVVSGPPGAETTEHVQANRRVILNGTILSFSKGSRAGRYLGGFGVGESKIKIRFALTDAKTGMELMSWIQTGTFKGTLSAFGGSTNQATAGATNGVVKGLIKQIAKNR